MLYQLSYARVEPILAASNPGQGFAGTAGGTLVYFFLGGGGGGSFGMGVSPGGTIGMGVSPRIGPFTARGPLSSGRFVFVIPRLPCQVEREM